MKKLLSLILILGILSNVLLISPVSAASVTTFYDSFDGYSIGDNQTSLSKWDSIGSGKTVDIISDPRLGASGKVLRVDRDTPVLSKSGLDLKGDFTLSFDMYVKRTSLSAPIDTNGNFQKLSIIPNGQSPSGYWQRFLITTDASAHTQMINGVNSTYTMPVVSDPSDPANWRNYKLVACGLGTQGGNITLYVNDIKYETVTSTGYFDRAGYDNARLDFNIGAWVTTGEQNVLLDNINISYLSAMSVFQDDFNGQIVGNNKAALTGWDSVGSGKTVDIIADPRSGCSGNVLRVNRDQPVLTKAGLNLIGDYDMSFDLYARRTATGTPIDTNGGFQKFSIIPNNGTAVLGDIRYFIPYDTAANVQIKYGTNSGYTMPVATDPSNASQWHKYKIQARGIGTSGATVALYVDDILVSGPTAHSPYIEGTGFDNSRLEINLVSWKSDNDNSVLLDNFMLSYDVGRMDKNIKAESPATFQGANYDLFDDVLYLRSKNGTATNPSISSAYAKKGEKSIMMSCNPSTDAAVYDRTELLISNGFIPNGTTKYSGFSMYFPSGFPPTSSWFVLHQMWQNTPYAASPPISLYIKQGSFSGNSFVITANIVWGSQGNIQWQAYDIPVTTGQWYDFVIQWKADSSGSGVCKVWKNGTLAANYSGPIGYSDANENGLWEKFGLYRGGGQNATHTVYFDQINSADTYSAADPNR